MAAQVVSLTNIRSIQDEKQRWNQRWRSDPAFKQGFDYEKPEYADCADDLRWLLPLAEHRKSTAHQAYLAQSRQETKEIVREIRREKFSVVSEQKR